MLTYPLPVELNLLPVSKIFRDYQQNQNHFQTGATE